MGTDFRALCENTHVKEAVFKSMQVCFPCVLCESPHSCKGGRVQKLAVFMKSMQVSFPVCCVKTLM